MRISNEFKAGIVVLAALLVTAFFMLKTCDFRSKPYEIKTYFTYAGDIKENAIVKLSGIEVGRVSGTRFLYEPETRIECTLSIDDRAKVRKDSVAYIGISGVVGDSYVGITAGSSAEFLKDGDTIASEEPLQMRESMKRADNIAKNVEDIVAENKDKIANMMTNLEGSTKNLEGFSADVKTHPWKLLNRDRDKRR